MDSVIRDIRYGARLLRREPGVTMLAIAALALGIGAVTATFTVVDSVLLRPLPYKDPGRLVVALMGPSASDPVSPADYFDYRRDARAFEHLSAAQAWAATLGGGDRPERITGLRVGADMFELLGVPAALGRTFRAGEDEPGHDAVVVLSHGLWVRRFAASPSIVGQAILLDGRSYLVVGVMPASFRFAPFWQTRAEMWAPLTLAPRLDDRAGRSLRVFGRLKSGVRVSEAQAEISTIAARLAQAYPETNTGATVTVRPLLDKVVAGIRPTLVALMAMVTLVLLIACANVANTLLARAIGRQREVALRVAIGASRRRVVRQLLTESLLLAVLGAAGGLLLAWLAVEGLRSSLPAEGLPRQDEIGFDLRVFTVAALATLAAGVTAGLAPALQVLRSGMSESIHDGGKGATEGTARRRVRALLVAGQMTLALTLLYGAGLLGRTMMQLAAVEPGFELDRAAVTVSLQGTPDAQPAARLAMFRQVREELAAMPGIDSVSAINHLPLAGDVWRLGYRIDGMPPLPPAERLAAVYRIVKPDYFATMGVRMLAGREFSRDDGPAAPPVAVVNQALADRNWPAGDAVGRRIVVPGPNDSQAAITIVGVAADVRQSDWTAPPLEEIYLPYAQRSTEFGLSTLTFVLKTGIDPQAAALAVPRHIARFNRALTVSEPTTLRAVVAEELWRQRLTGLVTGGLAFVALGLGAIGLYAIVACSVSRRTREFGVRLALGATRRDVVRLAIAEALVPVAAGSAVGLALALAGGRLMQALLFEVSGHDTWTAIAAPLLLALVALPAAWFPSRRAGRVDPVAALRQE